MDYLPTEISAHILSFLPGKEVARFKQLNSSFSEVISTYRQVLKYPEVQLSMWNSVTTRMVLMHIYGPLLFLQGIQVSLKYEGRSWVFDYVYPDLIEPSQDFWFYVAFLGPFFSKRKRSEERTLRSLFDYILERCDVSELRIDQLLLSNSVPTLTEAVKDSRARIISVITSPFNFKSKYIRILLGTIAANRRTTFKYPRLFVDETVEKREKLAPNLKKILEFAQLFGNASLLTDVSGTTSFIEEFAEEWRKDPYDVFIINIYVKIYKLSRPRKPYILPRLDGQFEITTVFQEYFEDHHPDDLDSAIILEDRHTGNILYFEKTNFRRPTMRRSDYNPAYHGIVRPHGLVRIEISALLKQKPSE